MTTTSTDTAVGHAVRSTAESGTTEVRTRTQRGDRNRAGWLFSTPFLVLYALFLVGPVLIGIVVSLFNTATVSAGLGSWVGASNYADVLSSRAFWASMWHSTLFTL